MESALCLLPGWSVLQLLNHSSTPSMHAVVHSSQIPAPTIAGLYIWVFKDASIDFLVIAYKWPFHVQVNFQSPEGVRICFSDVWSDFWVDLCEARSCSQWSLWVPSKLEYSMILWFVDTVKWWNNLVYNQPDTEAPTRTCSLTALKASDIRGVHAIYIRQVRLQNSCLIIA